MNVPSGDPAGVRRRIGRPPNGDSAATRRAILDAASTELVRTGLDGLNLETVAGHAGITRGAIYKYFDSKRDLARAAVREATDGFDEAVETFVHPAQGIARQLRALVLVSANVVFNDPVRSIGYYEMGRFAEEDEEIAVVFRARSRQVRTVIVALVRRASERGELVPGADENEIVETISGLIWIVGAGAAAAPNDAVRRQVILGTEVLLQKPPWLA